MEIFIIAIITIFAVMISGRDYFPRSSYFPRSNPSPQYLGKQGEDYTAQNLKWADILGYHGKLLRNLYVPRGNGTTSEIDIVYITAKGVFVIENKNYSGYIFGNENSPYWTQTLYGGKTFWGDNKIKKNRFYNPIWQNNSHLKALHLVLPNAVPLFSIIVFSGNCELKDIQLSSYPAYVCTLKTLGNCIHDIWQSNEDFLSEVQIEAIYNMLFPMTITNQVDKNIHIQNVQNKLNDVEICPICGGRLVQRVAKSGKNAGQSFLGCSNYPRCRYTRNI